MALMTKKTLLAAMIAALALTGLAETAQAAPLPATVTQRNFFRSGNDSLVFNRPILARPFPSEDSTYVVVQQSGQIYTVRWLDGKWQRTDTAVISGLAGGTSGGDEQGLLGFAFHPNFRANRKYYLYYVTGTTNATRANVLVERTTSPFLRPRTGDAQTTIFRIADPYTNHNGGTIAFGPDGYLYVGTGDGGDGGDPGNRAQNKMEMLGKVLRLNVDGPDAFPLDTTRNYAIPADNPFKDSANYNPAIWAYGVRNPWKWSFHPLTGEIWLGDVGQGAYEEITRVPKGANLGWKIREGAFCYSPSTGCPSAGLHPPAITIRRSHGASITGGAWFIGQPGKAYDTVYIFSDYVTDNLWAMRDSAGFLRDSTRIGTLLNGVSFDRTPQGTILATSIGTGSDFGINNNTGRVYVLESPDMVPANPVNLRPAVRSPRKALTLGEFLRDPSRYTVHALDGRELRGMPRGTVMVREKGVPGPGRLMTFVW
jgi:glucose/arabinose dehydrogenase